MPLWELITGNARELKAHPLFLFWGETNPREFHDGPKEAAPQHSACVVPF